MRHLCEHLIPDRLCVVVEENVGSSHRGRVVPAKNRLECLGDPAQVPRRVAAHLLSNSAFQIGMEAQKEGTVRSVGRAKIKDPPELSLALETTPGEVGAADHRPHSILGHQQRQLRVKDGTLGGIRLSIASAGCLGGDGSTVPNN